MLDAIKGLTATGRRQRQTEDLQRLLAEARAEREALATALTHFTEQRAALTALDDSLRRVDDKAGASARRLDSLSARLDDLNARTEALTAVDTRIQSLAVVAEQTQANLQALGAPEGELGAYRRQVQQLSAQAADVRANAATATRAATRKRAVPALM